MEISFPTIVQYHSSITLHSSILTEEQHSIILVPATGQQNKWV